jgi:hypothetical protein
MNPINVKNEVEVYEIDGEETKTLKSQKESLIIKNHWNRWAFVVIKYKDTTITVIADDLERAIKNAQNAHKY